MKKWNRLAGSLLARLFAVALIVPMALLFSCDDDEEGDPVATEDIVTIAQGNSDLSSLVTALSVFPDLVTALSSSGTYTVFAPDNAAFTSLLNAYGWSSVADVPEPILRDVLEYHVIASAELFAADLSTGNSPATVQGETIAVDVSSGVTLNGSADVTTADIDATNGVVHIINEVIVPPTLVSTITAVTNTVLEGPFLSANHTDLVAAVTKAGLVGTLTDAAAQYTLFAPDNDAFADAGIDVDALSAAELTPVLLYHVIGMEVKAADLPVTTVASQGVATAYDPSGSDPIELYISNKSGGMGPYINAVVTITGPDTFDPANGVVHLVDAVILPPSDNVVEIAQGVSGEFTALEAALARTSGEATDLLAALTSPGDYTVFAPTDAAFQALLDSEPTWNTVDDIPLATLTAVLQHHVVAPGADLRAFSVDLAGGTTTYTTLNGDIEIDGTTLTITDGQSNTANIVAASANILGTNGVIHVIDAVLIP